MVTVVRRDLTAGYQTAQSVHVATELAYKYSEQFKEWRNKSGYIISLSVRDEDALTDLIAELECKEIDHTVFKEPDINDEMTAVAFFSTYESDEITKKLQLANVKAGTKDKNNK